MPCLCFILQRATYGHNEDFDEWWWLCQVSICGTWSTVHSCTLRRWNSVDVWLSCRWARFIASRRQSEIPPVNWVSYFTFLVPARLYLSRSVTAHGDCRYVQLRNIFTCLLTYLPSVLWRCWLGSRKGIRPVKNWVMGCWHGYLSGARCRFAYGPSDATATHCFLFQ